MFSHKDIWNGIDRLAAVNDLSTSGLAKKAGLDPTTFNKSKRETPEGKPRWPSTESLSKILSVTGTTLSDLTDLIENAKKPASHGKQAPFSVTSSSFSEISSRSAGISNYKEEEVSTLSCADFFRWDDLANKSVLKLKMDTNQFAPFYPQHYELICVVDDGRQVGDRVVLKPANGKALIGEITTAGGHLLEIKCMNGKDPTRRFEYGEILWSARIIWVYHGSHA